jgi:alkyl hydroperoxide reductase subunit AhpC
MNTKILAMGDPAPDFVLPGDTGKAVRLSEFLGKRVILYFYPKDDTTGCTTQACGFRDHYPEILERNALNPTASSRRNIIFRSCCWSMRIIGLRKRTESGAAWA